MNEIIGATKCSPVNLREIEIPHNDIYMFANSKQFQALNERTHILNSTFIRVGRPVN